MANASPRVHVTRRIMKLQQDKIASQILEQTKHMCTEFVEAKLERDGFLQSSRKNKPVALTSMFISSNVDSSVLVSRRMQDVGQLLEECYPRLYTNIPQHVNTVFTSENVVNEVFNNVATEIVHEGVNWARIAAVFTFAGALTSECYRNNKIGFVSDISNWMYEFSAMHLVDWIKKKGGWDDFLRVFPRPSLRYYITTTEGRWKLVLSIAECAKLLLFRGKEFYVNYVKQLKENSEAQAGQKPPRGR